MLLSVSNSSECTTKSGTAAGTCAQGFGVCCTCKLPYEALDNGLHDDLTCLYTTIVEIPGNLLKYQNAPRCL